MSASPAPLLNGLEIPWDHEMALLQAGERSLVKREFVTAGEVTRLRHAGWTVSVVEETYGLEGERPEITLGEGDERTAFVGREDAVRRAIVLEQAERHDRTGNRLQAMAEIGSLLGYPRCCTEAYLRQDDQGETASFERLIQTGPSAGLPPTNNLFVLSHQLISHFPCSLDCGASASVGESALTLLRSASSQHADALLRLLRSPIVVWDRFRILVEHPDEGPIAADRLSHEPRLLGHPGFQAFHEALPEVPPGGARLCFDQERAP